MNALAKDEVGRYFEDNFVCAFQKVGEFRLANGQKQGGNVASYFCTPEGNVLHAVAGPVDAATLLREARWVVEARKMATLQVRRGVYLQEFFRRAHAARLQKEHGHAAPRRMVATPSNVMAVLRRRDGLNNAGSIHLLLAAFPMAPIQTVYRPVFEQVLGETVSTNPVAVVGR